MTDGPVLNRKDAPTVWPRLMLRKEAARYMGRSLRKFDEIKHLFRVEDDGLIRYDMVLMDRYILLHASEFAA